MVNTQISKEELQQEIETFFDQEGLGRDTRGYIYFVNVVFAMLNNPKYLYGKFMLDELYEEAMSINDTKISIVSFRQHLRRTLASANEKRAEQGLPAYTNQKFITICINRFAKYAKRLEQ